MSDLTPLPALHRNSKIVSATILVQAADGSTLLTDRKGGLTEGDTFAIASISKLYTHAVIFRLIDDGLLRYDSRVEALLPDLDLAGLPAIDAVTVRHLIDQNSGFADYETDRLPGRPPLIDEIIRTDRGIPFDEALSMTKRLKPRSQPGAARAHYANLNAGLLGRIAEVVTGRSLAELYDEFIAVPLGLTATQPLREDEAHWPIYQRQTELVRSAYIAGGLASGGLVATNLELAAFTRGFFAGTLFDRSHITSPTFRFTQWFPLKYGAGMMQMSVPRFLSIVPTPELIGHSGASGSFAFTVPSRGLIVTGTINQLAVRPFSFIWRYLNLVS